MPACTSWCGFAIWRRNSKHALIEAARSKGVGVYPVSALFDRRRQGRRSRPEVVGLVMGFAALEVRQIERGCTLLAQAVDEVAAGRRS